MSQVCDQAEPVAVLHRLTQRRLRGDELEGCLTGDVVRLIGRIGGALDDLARPAQVHDTRWRAGRRQHSPINVFPVPSICLLAMTMQPAGSSSGFICRRRILKHPRSCLGEKRGNHETNLQQSHPRTGHTREQDAKRTREQDAKQTHERRHESTGTKVQSAQLNHQSASKATTTHGHTHSQPPHAPTRLAPD